MEAQRQKDDQKVMIENSEKKVQRNNNNNKKKKKKKTTRKGLKEIVKKMVKWGGKAGLEKPPGIHHCN